MGAFNEGVPPTESQPSGGKTYVPKAQESVPFFIPPLENFSYSKRVQQKHSDRQLSPVSLRYSGSLLQM
jgi:hypothetical protein